MVREFDTKVTFEKESQPEGINTEVKIKCKGSTITEQASALNEDRKSPNHRVSDFAHLGKFMPR